MSDATAHLVSGAREFDLYRDALTDLFAAVDLPATAQFGPLSTWWRHKDHSRWRHQDHSSPWSVVLTRGDRVVAAALMERRLRAGMYTFELLGEPGVPRRFPALDVAAADDLARATRAELSALRLPWVLNLRDVQEDDPVAAAILARWPRAYRCHIYDSPRLTFAPDAELNRYVSRNTRSAVAKARNRIKRDGLSFAMDWHCQSAAMEATVEEMVELYRERSDQKHQSVGLLTDPGYRAYFAEMLRSHLRSGHAKLLTVRLNEELASYALCLDNRGVLFVYSNRTSPRWLRYSPGTIANAEVVRTAYADDTMGAVDWGGGIQRYKLSGHAVLHPHFDVRASSSQLAQRTFDGLHRTSRSARRAHHIVTSPARLIHARRSESG